MAITAVGLLVAIFSLLLMQKDLQDKGGLVATAPELPALRPIAQRQGLAAPDWVIENLPQNESVYLNYWASWCEPCAKELPIIQSLHEKFSPEGLKVVLVNMDTEHGNIQKARAMMTKLAPKLTSIYISEQLDPSQPSLAALPYHILLDFEQKVALEFYRSLVEYKTDFTLRLQELVQPDLE